MHTFNSDGYILIDLKEADMSKSSQSLPGLYNRVVEEVKKVNKLAIVINAGDLTPMAAIVNRTLNYYVITTNLYIFKINTNDILIIEEAGEVTVDVSIVPTLLSGTKIADYAIGSTEGSLYAPTQQTEINDNTKSDHTTWSSDKIDTLLGTKADSSSLSTVATTGSYTDLSNKPTIPTKVSELQNDSGYVASSSLATVATTGAYSDLTGTPTIPTKVSELQNDSGYITDSALSNYQTKTDSTYNVGDVITASVYKHCAGRTTNAGDKVLFFYPTAKPISGNCSSASLAIASGTGQCFTSAGAKTLKAGTYTGTITDGGLYFLIDLDTAFSEGGRVATAELQSRTITFS